MRPLGLVLVVLSCAGCFIEPQDGPRTGAPVAGADRAAAARTEEFVAAELGAWRGGGSGPERLDRAARALGASGYAELAELAARDCLDEGGVGRFAAARGLSVPAARSVLSGGLGVRVCGR